MTKRRGSAFLKSIRRDKYLIIMVLPCIVYFVIFHFIPMFWNIIAFQKYNIRGGIFESSWVGLGNFQRFFASPNAARVIGNTFIISFMDLILGFPVPIIFALFLSEIKNKYVKRTIQTFTYLPHFISVVVVVGMMKIFLSPTDGIVNHVITSLGGSPLDFFSTAALFRLLYLLSNIRPTHAWESTLYFAALAGLHSEFY